MCGPSRCLVPMKTTTRCPKVCEKSAKARSTKIRADDRRIRKQPHQEHDAQLRLPSFQHARRIKTHAKVSGAEPASVHNKGRRRNCCGPARWQKNPGEKRSK